MRKLVHSSKLPKYQLAMPLPLPIMILSTPSASSVPFALSTPPTPPTETIANLHRRLEEANQRCSITKFSKVNSQIFTYDYLRFLSIHRFIQLLLSGQG